MKNIKLFSYSILYLVILFSGCNPVLVETRHQFEEKDRVKSFDFTESSEQLNMDEYNRNLLKMRVIKELEKRGYESTESDS